MILISISDKIIPSENLALALLRAYSKFMGRDDISGASYTHLENGAPVISGADFPVYVSISHSESRVACALSDAPVGIDIQYMRPLEYVHISNRFGIFPENLSEFYKIWTMAEANIKCSGASISEALKNPSDNTRVLNFYDDYALAVCGKGSIFIYPYVQLLP